MAAPIGATVTLAPYDCAGDDPDPEPGDVLVSVLRDGDAGTAYRILASRLMVRSARPRRYALRCQVLGPARTAPIEPGARLLGIVWHRRDRRQPR